jgi:hypothetical protein
MMREEDKQQKYKEQRSKEAIALAMQANWKEAVGANKEILQAFPGDVDTLNRLGRAYMELGQYKLSRDAYSNAVKVDPYNAIANRNLRRLHDLKDSAKPEVEIDKVDPDQFIEEIGKAGVVTLVDLAQKEKRASTVAGDKAVLKLEGTTIMVENGRGEYLGKAEPKRGQRLVRLMLGGNKYSAVVVKSTAESVTVMVRETYQDPSQAGKLSFSPKGVEEFRAYGTDRLLKSEPEGEEEDESGYTIVGGKDVEVLAEEHDEEEDDTGNEEE